MARAAMRRWYELATIIGICAFAAGTVVYVGLAGFDPADPGIHDNREYATMWDGDRDEVQKPFRWRILAPLLAQALPGSFEVSFGLINIAALLVAGVALYYLLKEWGAEARTSLIGVALFYLSHTVLRFGGIPLVESPALAVLLVAMLAIERGKSIAFMLLVIVGMFVKETTAILLLYPWLMSRTNLQRIKSTMLVMPGLLAYAVFRLILDPVTFGYGYSFTAWFDNLITLFTPSMEAFGDWRAIVLAFGFLWVFFIIGLRSGGLVPRRYALMVPACFLAALVLSTDFERVLFLSFPVVLAFALPALERALNGATSGAASTSDKQLVS